jgi:hypothetical protein
MPVIGAITRAFDSIPVYRRQDDPSATNNETFDRARDLLARGGSLAIFPEGTTHSEAALRELKTGAARIALGASLPSLVIVPAGIYYTAKQTFRSAALVSFGQSIAVPPSPVDERGEPRRDDVEHLTGEIERGMAAVTLQAESRRALELIERAERIFTAGARPLADEMERRRRFVDGYQYLRAHDPAKLARLESMLEQFESELGRAGLAPEELKPRFDARAVVVLVLLLPAGVAGVLLHYPAYRVVDLLSRRFARGEGELTATVKFLAALLLYPLTWLVLAAVIWIWKGPWLACGAMVVMPLLGYAAMRLAEGSDEILGSLRALRHRMSGHRGYLRLLARQNAIREEIAAVAQEIDERAPTSS